MDCLQRFPCFRTLPLEVSPSKNSLEIAKVATTNWQEFKVGERSLLERFLTPIDSYLQTFGGKIYSLAKRIDDCVKSYFDYPAYIATIKDLSFAISSVLIDIYRDIAYGPNYTPPINVSQIPSIIEALENELNHLNIKVDESLNSLEACTSSDLNDLFKYSEKVKKVKECLLIEQVKNSKIKACIEKIASFSKHLEAEIKSINERITKEKSTYSALEQELQVLSSKDNVEVNEIERFHERLKKSSKNLANLNFTLKELKKINPIELTAKWNALIGTIPPQQSTSRIISLLESSNPAFQAQLENWRQGYLSQLRQLLEVLEKSNRELSLQELEPYETYLKVIANTELRPKELSAYPTHEEITKLVEPLRSPLLELRGIPNLGNTCWLNTVLQTLFVLEPEILASKPDYGDIKGANQYGKIREAFIEVLQARINEHTLRAKLENLVKVIKDSNLIVHGEIREGMGSSQQDARYILKCVLQACGFTFDNWTRIEFKVTDEMSKEALSKEKVVVQDGKGVVHRKDSERGDTLLVRFPEVAQGEISKPQQVLDIIPARMKSFGKDYKPDGNIAVEFTSKAYVSKLGVKEGEDLAPPVLVLDFDRLINHFVSLQQVEAMKGLLTPLAPQMATIRGEEALPPFVIEEMLKASLPRSGMKKINTPLIFPQDLTLKLPLFGPDFKEASYKVVSFTCHYAYSEDGQSGHWVSYRTDKKGKWRKYSDNAPVEEVSNEGVLKAIEQCNQVVLRKI